MKLYYYPNEILHYLITSREDILNALKVNILYMIQRAGSGHIGSAFSVLPIMWDIYTKKQPEDIIFSSKGHDCGAYYAINVMFGNIPQDRIHNFRKIGGLQGHPHPKDTISPFHTGSLGMGLSKAQGLALADKLLGRDRKIHVIIGDGELQEGQNHEAIRNILFHRLIDRIEIYVDRNMYQCDDVNCSLMVYEACSYIHIVNTEKGYGGTPLHAGILIDDEYERIVGELIAELAYKPKCIEYSRTEKPWKANNMIHAYKMIIKKYFNENENILLLNSDLAVDCGISSFRDHRRFIEFGISEQDMVSAASGLAYGGYLPIVHSFAEFLCRRSNEQIYNNCCEGRKIIYIGAFSGILPYGPGETHECIEDINLMKTMPNMNVFQPCNSRELRSCLYHAIYETEKSSYISIPCIREIENARK